jgi:hypothetical protein
MSPLGGGGHRWCRYTLFSGPGARVYETVVEISAEPTDVVLFGNFSTVQQLALMHHVL